MNFREMNFGPPTRAMLRVTRQLRRRPALLVPVALVAIALCMAASTAPASAGSGQGSVVNSFDLANRGALPKVANPGQYLFIQSCSTCHGIEGRGTQNAPSLVGVGAAAADFYLSSGRMPLNQPVIEAPRKKPIFSREQINAIVGYVSTFGEGPAIPTVDSSQGNLVEGNQLYADNCAACHNSAGSGGALGRNYYAPRLFDATPQQVAEAVRVGPATMPVFGPNTLTASQVDSIVQYVGHLKNADNRGGLALGHVGPVPEGFFAWFVGLGLLLGVTRWIGTRV